jgi:hypothetical protein
MTIATDVLSTGETQRSLFSPDQLDMLSRWDQEINDLLKRINAESLANNQDGVTQTYWLLVRYINEAISLAHSDFMENIAVMAINNATVRPTQLLIALNAHKEILEHYDFIKIQVIGWLVDHGIEVSDRRKIKWVATYSQDTVKGIIEAS